VSADCSPAMLPRTPPLIPIPPSIVIKGAISSPVISVGINSVIDTGAPIEISQLPRSLVKFLPVVVVTHDLGHSLFFSNEVDLEFIFGKLNRSGFHA